ncbi:unnamed protein product [Mytilus edulis]|uniref:Uncharacterized protein n=1 Tax=Mytilus edulis TaxID=6550 RepID=A0A8S3S6S4_MYTED|nr:unnamed protein product [Mytilus edulis]
MANEDVREYDSDAFTSLWMLQNVCKNYDILRFKEIPELRYILNKPYVNIYSSTAISSEEATIFVSSSHEGRKVPRSEKINPTKTVERPFVILIILNPLEKNGLCYLSEHDGRLVKQKRHILQNIDYVVFVVKGNFKHVNALQHLSCELHQKIHGDKTRNRIFPKIYRFPDDQIEIRTRVGLCVHASILTHLQVVSDKVSDMQHQMSLERGVLSKHRAKLISFVKKMLTGENLNVCTSPLKESNHKIFKDLSQNILVEISHRRLLVSTLVSSDVAAIDRVFQILKENLDKVLLDKIPVLKECQVKRNSTATGKQNARITKHPYHREKTLLSKSVCTSTSSMTSNRHRCTDKCKMELNKTEKNKAAKGIFKGIFQHVTECEDNLSSFSRSLSDELTRRGDSIMLHEWKTVSLRNAKVKGFGCMDDTICLYLQHDNDKDKTEVSKYINEYFDDATLKYKINIEYRSSKITLFAFLQQGKQNQS